MTAAELPGTTLRWTDLPALPDPVGYAGAFAGVSGGALLVAGGANFPDNRGPWGGSAKAWNDRVWALESPDGIWREAGRLLRPLGYGVALNLGPDLLCVGGADAERHHADVFTLEYSCGRVRARPMPPLPVPLANATGALVEGVIYVAGGLAAPEARRAERVLLRLDPARLERGWEELSGWPGPALMLATAGELHGRLTLVGGAELVDEPGSASARRVYHAEAYSFDPETCAWSRLATAPRAVVAAPSPGLSAGGRFYILGGDDGSLAARVSELALAHPGFCSDVLEYDPVGDRWRILTEPSSGSEPGRKAGRPAPVATPLVRWGDRAVLASGEIRPGVRSNQVSAAVLHS